MKFIKKIAFVAAAVCAALFIGCSNDAGGGSSGGSSGGSGVTPASDFVGLSVTPGASVTTYGWADRANSGSGMSYPDTTNIIYIGDDGYKVGTGSLTSYSSSVTKRSAFTNAIASGSVSSSSKNTNAAIIVLSGTVDLSDGKISDTNHKYYNAFDDTTHARIHDDTDVTFGMGSNKTIIGANNAKIAFGGIKISGKENIIIRNVTFWDAHGSTEYDTSVEDYKTSKASIDALGIESADKVWVDHCKFTDGTCKDLSRNYNHDGAFDIKKGQYITVSYCEFTNHDKIMLIAPGDTYTTPEDRQITLHHNYFYGATQRMPRSRGCQMHIYNNYWNDIGNSDNVGYSLGPGIGSQYIVENNYFGSFASNSSIIEYFDPSEEGASTVSKFYQSGNNITITASNVRWDGVEKMKDFSKHNTSTKPWTISYSYATAMETAATVKENLSTHVGPYCTNVTVKGVNYSK